MKTKRQAKMLELIKRNDIETQEELSDYLEREGYQVTQATVSTCVLCGNISVVETRINS